MSERDDLAVRAEVLSKLADQLGEQLAVERKANDELRTILRDGPTSPGFQREEGVAVAPVATTLAAVAVGMSICAAVAASWIGTGSGSTCHARQTSFVAATSAAASTAGTIAPPAPVAWSVAAQGKVETPAAVPFDPWPNPRECGRVVNATAARCFVDATGGEVSGEYMLRNLVLAHTLLGERARGRELAKRYFRDYGGSPFAQQIRQLGYNP